MDLIQQTIELIGAFGVTVSLLELNDRDKSIYDKGLRFSLYKDFDYMQEVQKMDEFYEKNTVYMVRDTFEEHYISMRLPDQSKDYKVPSFLHIGPYLRQKPEAVMESVIEKNNLPMIAGRELKEHYRGIPCVKEPDILESIAVTQAGYLWGGQERPKINRIENLYGKKLSYPEILEEIGDQMSYSAVEERYGYEQEMLNAVKEGNLEKALEYGSRLMRLGLAGNGPEENIRKGKNRMIVLNTLFRKVVQEADIHPAHIDGISGIFFNKIEGCSCLEELKVLNREMTRKYCILVRNHSLRGYSETIRNVLNYIDFHVQDPLTLKNLASAVNVNATYLSGQFKKETGRTVTDYVNEKRIHDSLVFVAATDLPISKIAEMVGIYDENYFSRLFKKYQGRTAVQYRNLMRAK